MRVPQKSTCQCFTCRRGVSSGNRVQVLPPPHPLPKAVTGTGLVMLRLSESRCLAPVQIRAASTARSREAAVRQAKIISKLLLCAPLSSAKLTAAGAF